MNFATMLAASVKPLSTYTQVRRVEERKPRKYGAPLAVEKYAHMCQTPTTCATMAAELGTSPDAVGVQMRRYEKRGWVERVGTTYTGGNTPSTLWKWKGASDAVES